MRLQALFLTFFLVSLFAFSAPASHEDPGKLMTELLTDFSNPLKKGESERILDRILSQLGYYASRGNFATADRHLDQLELARIGRTFSLYKSEKKRDSDRQIVKIRRFAVRFYRAWAAAEKSKDNADHAKKILDEAKKIESKLEATMAALGNPDEKDLPIHEDEFVQSPVTVERSWNGLIGIPTAFFLALHSPVMCPIPQTPAFLVLPTPEGRIEIVLNDGWFWSLENRRGIACTVVSGLSPAGHMVLWVAGPMLENRSLSCSQVKGRWVVSPGEPVQETDDKIHFR